VPAIPDDVPTGGSGLRKLGCEPMHPPVDGHVIDLDAAPGEELLQVPVRQAEPQVPPDGQGDDLGRKPVASEGRTQG